MSAGNVKKKIQENEHANKELLQHFLGMRHVSNKAKEDYSSEKVLQSCLGMRPRRQENQVDDSEKMRPSRQENQMDSSKKSYRTV